MAMTTIHLTSATRHAKCNEIKLQATWLCFVQVHYSFTKISTYADSVILVYCRLTIHRSKTPVFLWKFSFLSNLLIFPINCKSNGCTRRNWILCYDSHGRTLSVLELFMTKQNIILYSWFAFSALTLLVVCQEVVRCWRGYLSRARCKWSAYGPADATATPLTRWSWKRRQ